MIFNSEVTVWKEHHAELMKVCKEKGIPIFIMRQEDLIADPIGTCSEAFSFVLGVESIEGTVIQRKIREEFEQAELATLYKPRTEVKVGKAFHQVNSEQMN